jgi:hypothetical protein
MGMRALGNKIYTTLTTYAIFTNSNSIIGILPNFIIFYHGVTAPRDQGLPIIEGSRSYSDTTHAVTTPLDELSARRYDLYMTDNTQHSQQTEVCCECCVSMSPVGFEPTIPARERPPGSAT